MHQRGTSCFLPSPYTLQLVQLIKQRIAELQAQAASETQSSQAIAALEEKVLAHGPLMGEPSAGHTSMLAALPEDGEASEHVMMDGSPAVPDMIERLQSALMHELHAEEARTLRQVVTATLHGCTSFHWRDCICCAWPRMSSCHTRLTLLDPDQCCYTHVCNLPCTQL